MAVYRVKNTGDNTDGSTWAKAYTTIANALAAATADNDIIVVSSAHAGTYGAAQALNVATSGNHVQILCVTESGASGYSAVTTGATETITVNAAGFSILSSGSQCLYIQGIEFICNTGSSNSNSISIASLASAISCITCKSCTFTTQGTSTSGLIQIGPTGAATAYGPTVSLVDCTFKVRNAAGTTAGAILLGQGKIEIINPTITQSANKPVILFSNLGTSAGRDVLIEGNLNSYDATSGSLISVANFTGGQVVFRNVRYSTAVASTLVTGTYASNAFGLYFINCSSTDTKITYEFRNRLGTITATDSIYRSGGLTIKGTAVSWQVVTTASCNAAEPFVTPWVMKASTGTSTVTATMEICQPSTGASYDDYELWFDLEYVSSASFPIGTVLSGRNTTPFVNINPAATWATSSVTWTGISSPIKQNIYGSITPLEACDLMMRVCVGLASQTLYIDPVITVT